MTNTTHALPVSNDTVAPAVQDSGALRLGGLSPIFQPSSIADAGKLRLGGLSPIFQAR